MEYTTLDFEVREGVGRLTLNRPDVLNAMNAPMMRELLDVAIRCDEDDAVRAVLVTGSGRAFCAGGDVASFSESGAGFSVLVKEMTVFLHAAVSRLARMDAPLVCAVNGVAAGAGMSFVAGADLVLAAENAKFTMAYTRSGLVPDGSSTFFLARVVGLRRAQELVLTNRVLTAAEALDWGLVTRVVPDADLASDSERLALDLARGPTRAFGAAKRLLLDGTAQTLETQMELEARAIADAGRTADTREGIRAFVEKRPPRYEGR